MGGTGIIFAFFGIIALLSIFSLGTDLDTSTTTPDGTAVSQETSAKSSPVIQSQSVPRTQSETRLTDEQIERKLVTLYRELDRLEEDLREQKLREPVSPYANTVVLRSSNARNTDPEREYLTLTASTRNDGSVNISNWFLESYVTEERAAIPQGTRLPTSIRNNPLSDILLLPGDKVTINTSEPPLGFSFHENLCTGYFAEEGSFYPSLSRRCPDPDDDIIDIGHIELDNDACFDFVERMRRCELVDEKKLEEADLSRRCEVFVTEDLTYDGCLLNHGYTPFFDDVGMWRIYLDRDEDLWRREREIIRLIDENDRVVDVIEY